MSEVLNYHILRGKDKIGENLIEISYGGTKILVELGKALDGGEELSDLEKAVLREKYDAVVVSHYHADHAGLIGEKHDCPIYIGAGARRILEAMGEYRGKPLPENIRAYRSGRAYRVGKIWFIPYLCDHSAFDSYMLLFEAGGKSILYTGDFRFHGRKSSEALLARFPKRSIRSSRRGPTSAAASRAFPNATLKTAQSNSSKPRTNPSLFCKRRLTSIGS